MRNALFIVSTTRKAGPTQQLLHLCRLLPEFGYRPQLLTLSPEPRGDSLASEFQAAGVECHSLGMSRIEGALLLNSRVRSIVARLAPHVIHSQGIRSDAVACAVHGPIPHVLTVRNSAWDDYPSMFGTVRGSIMAWQHSALIRRAQCPVACSQSLARALTHVRAGMRAIANGVDTRYFAPVAKDERKRLRTALRLPAERPVLLHVGSLIPRKRPELLLRSFIGSALSKATNLVFVGDGPLREQLSRAAHGSANILFTGAVRNVVDYLRSADLLVSTSASEGLPNSVLEALACGLPVVLSDIEPHVEIGAHAAGCGVLMDPTVANELLQSIQDLLGRDRAELTSKARRLAEDALSSRAMVAKYAALYASLA